MSIIYHGALHTNQLILIIHLHSVRLFEKEQSFALFHERNNITFVFSRNTDELVVNSTRYLRPRKNRRLKITGDRGTRSGFDVEMRQPKLNFSSHLCERDLPLYRRNFCNTLLNTSPSLTPGPVELFIKTE